MKAKVGQKVFDTVAKKAVVVTMTDQNGNVKWVVDEEGNQYQIIQDILVAYSAIKSIIKFFKSLFKK